MGDLGWASQAAHLQRDLKGAVALGRRIAWGLLWSIYWTMLVACIALSVGGVVWFLIVGLLLIDAAVVEAWAFVDDPASGLRGAFAIGHAVLVGGSGVLLLGGVIHLALHTVRAGVASVSRRWSRRQRRK